MIYKTVSFKLLTCQMFISNVNIYSIFNEYILKAIQLIRNRKLRSDNHTIFDYVAKNFATNADVSLIDVWHISG